MNPVSVSTVKKTVLVSLLERNRPVEFTGGVEELTIATKETFRNLLGNKDPDIFFQLRDEDWGGLFVDVVDASKIPDRSVLKAVVVKSDLVSFSDYQQQVNAAAEKICLRTPRVICKCGTLLDLARKEEHDSGYVCKKGKSRSKTFGTCEDTPKRQKFDCDYPQRRMKELEEDLVGINKRISIKESRCEAEAAVKNFKLCDQLSDEVAELKKQRREKEAEVRELQKKEGKSKWYMKKKRLLATDEGDSLESSDDTESSSTASILSRNTTPQSPPFHVPQQLSPSQSIETGRSRGTSIEVLSDDESPTANVPLELHF